MSQVRSPFAECNCLAVRRAARHITQFYDEALAYCGLRTTQFSILNKLQSLGPLTINALARELVMDRTTLGRNVLPLEREGLIVIKQGREDRRSKELHIAKAGAARLTDAAAGWRRAQDSFETQFGKERAADMRMLLNAASHTEFRE